MLADDPPKFLPEPNDVAYAVLQNVLHVSPFVVGMIATAVALKAWLDLLASTTKHTRRLSVRIAGGLSRRARSGGLPLAVAVSACVAVAQALVLPLAYVYGNLVSLDVDGIVSGDTSLTDYDHLSDEGRRIDAFIRLWHEGSWTTVFDPNTYGILRLDLPCAVVLLVYLLGVLGSYKQSARDGRSGWAVGFLASLPFSILFFPAALGAVITLLNVWLFGYGQGRSHLDLAFLTGAALVCLAYWIVCSVALRASQISVAVWRTAGTETGRLGHTVLRGRP